MSDIIATDLQQLEPSSAFIDLFELALEDGQVLYFHDGLEADLSTVQFRDNASPYALRTYTAMPVLMEGLEMASDGAPARPSFTVANILSMFSGLSGDFTNDDLIGSALVRRRTLKKHLHGESAAGSAGTAPTEFPIIKYIIDRIASESNTMVVFEVAVPYDLEGIKLPRRVVVGKYCSWQYQGAAANKGGCSFPADSILFIKSNLNDDSTRPHRAFFDIDDTLLFRADWFTNSNAPDWASGQLYKATSYVEDGGKYWRCTAEHTSATGNKPPSAVWAPIFTYVTHDATNETYAVGDRVFLNDHIWRCIVGHNSSTSSVGTILPSDTSKYWVRDDNCGKTLQSCKSRFQYVPRDFSGVTPEDHLPPDGRKNTTGVLPFGGFPGTQKF